MTANTTQVGGEHYRAAPFQHWDLAARLKLGYFEGQITKYITRHPRKNGAQDALKALHFTVKLAELAVTGGWQPAHLYPTSAMLDDYAESNRLSVADFRIVRDVLTWRHRRDLERVKVAIAGLITRQYGSRYLADISRCLGGQEGLDALYAAVLDTQRADPGLFDELAKTQYAPVCAPEPEGDSYRSAAFVGHSHFLGVRPTGADQVSQGISDSTHEPLEPTDGSAPGAGYVNQD